MNLRILKKLSKRAAALLPEIGCNLKPFPAVKHENYHGSRMTERKHMVRDVVSDRSRACSWHKIIRPHRSGGFLLLSQPDTPLKGTLMVGWMSGYYEREWEEEDAWSWLRTAVIDHFTDYENYDEATMTRPQVRLKFRSPRVVLRALPEVIAAHQKREAERREWEAKHHGYITGKKAEVPA